VRVKCQCSRLCPHPHLRAQAGMDVPELESVLSWMGRLRRDLQRQLERLGEKQSKLEGEMQELADEIESKQRELELLEATERERQGRG
jgi:chromosome segregation ATPase